MRLKTFLNEDKYIEPGPERIKAVDAFCDRVKKDCRPFLALLKKVHPRDFIYRGFPSGVFIGKKRVRQDRLPSGMSEEMADALNKYLVEHDHVDRSKAVIATSKKDHCSEFGYPYYIFPIGRFNYTWFNSREEDVNYDYMFKKTMDDLIHAEYYIGVLSKPNYNRITGKLIDMSNDINRWKDRLNSALERLDLYFVTNKGFTSACKMGKEIWFSCKEYYFLDHSYLNPIDLKEKLI